MTPTSLAATGLIVAILVASCSAADKHYDIDHFDDEFLADNPINDRTVTCAQAVKFQRNILELGNVIGRQSRKEYYEKVDGLAAQWLQRLDTISEDGDVDSAVGDVIDGLNGVWKAGSTLHQTVAKQFFKLDVRGVTLLVKSTGDRSLQAKLINIYKGIPGDIDKSAARGNALYKEQLARYQKVVVDVQDAMEDASQEELKYAIQAVTRLQIADAVAIITEFSKNAYDVHHASDLKVEAILDKIKCHGSCSDDD